MSEPESIDRAREEYRQGLRMAHPPDPDALRAERAQLAELDSKGPLSRGRHYLKLVGPGYLQSAMTLGGGTAAASLFAGAVFGYQLLWVAPVAMLLGIVMLAAVSHQTLSTGIRPFEAMRRFAGAPLAWAWAIGALLSSIIWHFPQYSLASVVLADMGDAMGVEGLSPKLMGFIVLLWAVGISALYGSSPRLMRWYERLLKYMVWGIVVCFGIVVFRTGVSDWGELWRGFFAFQIPEKRNGVEGVTVVLSGLSAAVGINMVFLYPYSLLARGWGREHRRLARFDLYLGMLIPFSLATSLMVIATANTVHLDPDFSATSLSPVEAARALTGVAGETVGRFIFGFGILGMALSSITLHMLTTGFVCSELFGWSVGSWRYRLATLLPTPGVLGPFFWGDMLIWVAVPTSILCGLFLPAAYIGFIRLQASRDYLGDDRPSGGGGNTWLGAMIVITLFLIVFLGWFSIQKGPRYFDTIFGG